MSVYLLPLPTTTSLVLMQNRSSFHLELLQVFLCLDELVDLFDEVGLRLGDHSLNLVDFLVHNLVDLLHVVKHLVGLIVESVEMILVLLELELATVHLLARVVLLLLKVVSLIDVLLRGANVAHRAGAGSIQVRVLVQLVVTSNRLLSLLLDGASKLLQVTRERLSEHL